MEYTEDVNLVGICDITYEVKLAGYPSVKVLSNAAESFQIDIRDPCKEPLLTFTPETTDDMSYTLLQQSETYPMETFIISSPWCTRSYTNSTSDPYINAAITFDNTPLAPAFTIFLD